MDYVGRDVCSICGGVQGFCIYEYDDDFQDDDYEGDEDDQC